MNRAWRLAAGLVAILPRGVGSESLTLQTYYPSPIGIYSTLTTTGATLLARDGGDVGVATNAPTQALDVNGKIRMRVPTAAADAADTVATKGYVDQAVLQTKVKIESGHGLTPGQCPGTNSGGLCSQPFQQNIAFQATFTAPPAVVVVPEDVSQQGGCVGGATDKVVAYPSNITKTGFTLNIGGSPEAGSCGGFEGWYTVSTAGWIAVGY